jgi:hypothetical protein
MLRGRGRGAYENLFLPRIFPAPIRILLKAVRVKCAPHVTATARVFVVVPCAADACALFDDDEVVAFVAFYEVDGHAHALETLAAALETLGGGWLGFGRLTRDSGADYYDRGGGVRFVAHGDFGPWFGAAHVESGEVRCGMCDLATSHSIPQKMERLALNYE